MALKDGTRTRFRRRQVPISLIRDQLWTKVGEEEYSAAGEKYRSAILEQYKLYVEMADRIGARRSLTNTFFLTVNTALSSASAIFSADYSGKVSTLAVILLMLLVQCGAWFWILRSYRQLSSAKFRVVGALEERLPCSPYWRAEWVGVGSGKDRSLYWPLTRLEQAIPLAFGAAYVAIFVLVIT
ncbi:RipA family octameric membrane protein [Micromonospora sp. DT62]|uniref:RipA family octameric membrane protein n=1 Tax=Micromonospora sp. DT62 TaxID=3416521 RepID=UPI003CE767B8